MSAVLMRRSIIIRGNKLAMTVRSRAPRTTAHKAATSARLASRPAGKADCSNSVTLEWRLNGDRLVLIEEVKRPFGGIWVSGRSWFIELRAKKIERGHVDPEIRDDRRAVHRV